MILELAGGKEKSSLHCFSRGKNVSSDLAEVTIKLDRLYPIFQCPKGPIILIAGYMAMLVKFLPLQDKNLN